ncbi:hypothetical protein TanjilG_23456 [Lupinus angustifolius]|uniref:Uncharacterized protein n=1 Tax=Lupinus angustifolius TaxID=3871 RepID=A0A4P1R9G7_LUPAN|nr:PREDICTED: nucleophosmin-like [Lupinus angustifolius]OIW05670.1 hypothetical protein TanjilG_23456 [Lupinus angustifolius]
MENQSSSSSSQMQFLLLEQVEFLNVKDDSLFQWELVNVVDAEEDEESDNSIEDGFGSWNSPGSSLKDAPIQDIRHILLHPDDDHVSRVEVKDHHHPHDDDEVHDDDDGDDDGDDDLDDELIPWDVSNKMGRDRMRKLGKREFPKMHNSKRSPYLFFSRGCVRGKHGLGLKHNF